VTGRLDRVAHIEAVMLAQPIIGSETPGAAHYHVGLAGF
jgi:hypothetical protein